MAVTDRHVNGPALVMADTGNGLEPLGYSEAGVRMSFTGYDEDIYSDQFGPRIPIDVQYFGEEARIIVDLITWDQTVLAKVLTRCRGGTNGTNSPPGTLYAAQNKVIRVCVLATYSGEPTHNFPTAYLIGDHDVIVGTKVTRRHLEFRALPNGATGLLCNNISI